MEGNVKDTHGGPSYEFFLVAFQYQLTHFGKLPLHEWAKKDIVAFLRECDANSLVKLAQDFKLIAVHLSDLGTETFTALGKEGILTGDAAGTTLVRQYLCFSIACQLEGTEGAKRFPPRRQRPPWFAVRCKTDHGSKHEIRSAHERGRGQDDQGRQES